MMRRPELDLGVEEMLLGEEEVLLEEEAEVEALEVEAPEVEAVQNNGSPAISSAVSSPAHSRQYSQAPSARWVPPVLPSSQRWCRSQWCWLDGCAYLVSLQL